MKTKEDFKKYLKENVNSLNKELIGKMIKENDTKLYNKLYQEWRDTESMPTKYYAKNPVNTKPISKEQQIKQMEDQIFWKDFKEIEPINPETTPIEEKKEIVKPEEVKKTIYDWKPTDIEKETAQRQAEEVNKQYFDRIRWEMQQDYKSQIWEIDRLIQYTNTDYAKQLATENKWFARSLDKATNVYWQRWLLWSWIQKSQVWEATDDYQKSITNMEEYRRRKEEWMETQKSNIATKYDRWFWDLARQQETKIWSDYLRLMEENQKRFYGDTQQQESDYFYNAVLWKTTWPRTPITWWDVLEDNLKVK